MKAKSKKKAVAPKLTPEEIAINAAWRAKDLKADVPTLARCVLFDLLHPEQSKFKTLPRRKRERILAQRPEHWTSKLTLKLDRLVFPALTSGEKKLTEGKELGRLVRYYKTTASTAHFENLKGCQFGSRLAAKLLNAAWCLGNEFFTGFAKGLRNEVSRTLKVYSFLLRNQSAVEACKSPAEIQRLDGMPKYSPQSFCRLCKSVGLPVAT